MISRVADNLTIQASNQAVTTIRSDPVALGDFNLAGGTLITHQLTAPGGNTGMISVTPEYSNDGTYWQAPAGGAVISSNAGGDDVKLTAGYDCPYAYVRYKFEFDPAETGSDTGIGFVTFDYIARYSNQ